MFSGETPVQETDGSQGPSSQDVKVDETTNDRQFEARSSPFRRLIGFLDDDSRIRILLGLVAVFTYFGSALLVWFVSLSEYLLLDEAKEFMGTLSLCLGPIVAAVVGYYFGADSRTNGPTGTGVMALVITLLFFGPTIFVTLIGAWGLLEIELIREYLEVWVLFAGPFAGLIFGFYFGRNCQGTPAELPIPKAE